MVHWLREKSSKVEALIGLISWDFCSLRIMRLIILRSPKSLHLSCTLGDLKMYLGYTWYVFLFRCWGYFQPLSLGGLGTTTSQDAGNLAAKSTHGTTCWPDTFFGDGVNSYLYIALFFWDSWVFLGETILILHPSFFVNRFDNFLPETIIQRNPCKSDEVTSHI